ncbi:MAG: DNA repair protein RadA [Candidatus Omnitrophica bacterium]|nr:DNA repair protein RadA [Candidatus Omnitrophota bacterium]
MVTKTIFACQSCGYQSPKWLGRCPDCAQWNSLAEEAVGGTVTQGRFHALDIVSTDAPQRLSEIETQDHIRTSTNIAELDRVLGGGLVKGSVVLIGGEPGIGKSTLMLQASNIISSNEKVLYISGEESTRQMKLRADRLKVASENLYLLSETSLERIIGHIKELSPHLVVIDSIQTVYTSALGTSAGSPGQIRECAGVLTVLAKSLGISVFIIGHITKEGFIAGPKMLEHIVDSVVYFEGERHAAFRILRAIKNRFGPTDEVGIFQMGSAGLTEIKDPSGIFISHRQGALTGTSVVAAIEGTRPLLVELQALVTRSNFGMARQRSTGFDFNRMVLLIAVLEKNIGLNLSNHDVFLNVVGGVKVNEPASDLAACIAIASSFKEAPIRQDTVIIGEVGLGAEVRSTSQVQIRVNEAQRLGFKRCLIPKCDAGGLKAPPGLKLLPVADIKEALDHTLT